MNVHIGYLVKNIADKLHGRADANLKKHDLTFQQSKIIAFLSKNGNQASQKEIEEFLHVAHPTVVGLVARMEQNGFLQTHVDSKDKRNKIVELTPKAVAKWQELRVMIEQTENDLMKGLTSQQVQQFVAVLSKIYENIDTKKENYV